ncbi:MAG: phosphodiester glycosidase family protein [Deltaproteobacteria bacterium]|nr:phosphodiester glycosidase family protein [Deltaproteobacteria bacterium]MBW2305487.1 phosphodiester glycosidase family protein [Deltaproteobacteria bacterium]
MKTVIPLKGAIFLTVIILLGAGSASGDFTRSHSSPQWMFLGKGISFSLISAHRYYRKGKPDIALVRLEPSHVKLTLHHFRSHGADEPMNAAQWQRATGAMVVFNGSQYYPDLRPMGWFIQDGKNLGTSLVKGWKGLLAAHPTRPGLPPATVLDLMEHSYSLQSLPFKVAVQSMMLLDDRGNLRTRKSDWTANRTAVAEDSEGRILIVCTQGGYTLWEMAKLLREGTLGIRRAMVMDGGFETQLSVRSGSFSYTLYGQWSISDSGDRSMPGIRRPLPSVIGVDPMEKETDSRTP